jgi:hypothetical protein
MPVCCYCLFYTFCPLIPEDSPSPPAIAQVVKNVHQGLDLVPCSIFRNTLLTFRNKQTLRVSHVYLGYGPSHLDPLFVEFHKVFIEKT